MAAINTNYDAKNNIYSPITMKIVSVIYGFVCLEGQGIRISQTEKHLKRFFNFNCQRRSQTNSYSGDVYILLVNYICNVNWKYLHK